METLYLLFMVILIGVLLYFGRKYVNHEELLPIISDVVRFILQIEKENNKSSGIEKKVMVEQLMEQELESSAINKITRSPFKSIGSFVQYVFTVFAEPIILSKFKKR
ncbi:MAG: hypothetical protein FWG98_06760 [Candidatus Cloacimonetes bacterium]|nr:hypothetical protein [Candidatus Cloacimonadota bacterium]